MTARMENPYSTIGPTTENVLRWTYGLDSEAIEFVRQLLAGGWERGVRSGKSEHLDLRELPEELRREVAFALRDQPIRLAEGQNQDGVHGSADDPEHMRGTDV